MNLFITFFIALLLSLFSTTVMSYISMAAPIGPWIAPTLVLCATLIFALFKKNKESMQELALVTAAGSVGGIVSTAFAFSLPAIYFLDPVTFSNWLSRPFLFCSIFAALAFCAGAVGIFVAMSAQHTLIDIQQLPFPIGQLIYKMMSAGNQMRKALELAIGFACATLISMAQDGFIWFKGFLPRAITILQPVAHGAFALPLIRFDIWPMLWAIGFVTGHVIAIPLLVGAISKLAIIDPLNLFFFPTIASMDFVLAFCSGMVISGALLGFLISPRVIWQTLKKYGSLDHYKNTKNQMTISKSTLIHGGVVTIATILFLTVFKFSFLSQLFLIIASFISAYQLATIAGQMGIAPLGRYATFVMVPAMLIFKLDFVQIILIATFVEIAGGVAADILFSQKMGILAHVDRMRMIIYQYFGLIICSLSIGIVFWLFITHLHLGSDALFVYKAQSRALLVNAKQFNYLVLALGVLFGLVLKKIKMNPALVLGGLLMPLNLSLGLVTGGLLTLLVKNKEDYFPFWSGVFAANSLWMLLKTLL